MRRDSDYEENLQNLQDTAAYRKGIADEVSAFVASSSGKELARRIGEEIDILNKEYWEAGEKGDGVRCAYLTGKRAGLTHLTHVIVALLLESEVSQKDLLQWKQYEESLNNGYNG